MLFVTGTVPALAQGQSYFGVNLGQSNYRTELGACSGSSGILDPGYSCSSDRKDLAWKVYAGHEFNQYIAAEVSYAWLGKQRETASGTISLVPVSAHQERRVWGLTGALVGSLPITSSFGLTARLGLAYWNEETSVSAPGQTGSQTADGLGPAYGIGLIYGFNRHTGMRVEWERLSDVGEDAHAGDVDLVTVGIVHRY